MARNRVGRQIIVRGSYYYKWPRYRRLRRLVGVADEDGLFTRQTWKCNEAIRCHQRHIADDSKPIFRTTWYRIIRVDICETMAVDGCTVGRLMAATG